MMDLKDILISLQDANSSENKLLRVQWDRVLKVLWEAALRPNPESFQSFSVEKKEQFQKESALALELLIGISEKKEQIIDKGKEYVLKLAIKHCNDLVILLNSTETHISWCKL